MTKIRTWWYSDNWCINNHVESLFEQHLTWTQTGHKGLEYQVQWLEDVIIVTIRDVKYVKLDTVFNLHRTGNQLNRHIWCVYGLSNLGINSISTCTYTAMLSVFTCVLQWLKIWNSNENICYIQYIFRVFMAIIYSLQVTKFTIQIVYAV